MLPPKPKAKKEVPTILYIMCVKIVILILLGCCFVTFNEATKETPGSVDVTEENLEIQYGRVLAKLRKNHETLKYAFKFLDRKQRIVPSKYL